MLVATYLMERPDVNCCSASILQAISGEQGVGVPVHPNYLRASFTQARSQEALLHHQHSNTYIYTPTVLVHKSRKNISTCSATFERRATTQKPRNVQRSGWFRATVISQSPWGTTRQPHHHDISMVINTPAKGRGGKKAERHLLCEHFALLLLALREALVDERQHTYPGAHAHILVSKNCRKDKAMAKPRTSTSNGRAD